MVAEEDDAAGQLRFDNTDVNDPDAGEAGHCSEVGVSEIRVVVSGVAVVAGHGCAVGVAG